MRHCHGTADDTWRLPLLFCCNVTNKISSKDGSTRSGHSRTTFIAALYYLYSETTCFSSGVERRCKSAADPSVYILRLITTPCYNILGFCFSCTVILRSRVMEKRTVSAWQRPLLHPPTAQTRTCRLKTVYAREASQIWMKNSPNSGPLRARHLHRLRLQHYETRFQVNVKCLRPIEPATPFQSLRLPPQSARTTSKPTQIPQQSPTSSDTERSLPMDQSHKHQRHLTQNVVSQTHQPYKHQRHLKRNVLSQKHQPQKPRRRLTEGSLAKAQGHKPSSAFQPATPLMRQPQPLRENVDFQESTPRKLVAISIYMVAEDKLPLPQRTPFPRVIEACKESYGFFGIGCLHCVRILYFIDFPLSTFVHLC